MAVVLTVGPSRDRRPLGRRQVFGSSEEGSHGRGATEAGPGSPGELSSGVLGGLIHARGSCFLTGSVESRINSDMDHQFRRRASKFLKRCLEWVSEV